MPLLLTEAYKTLLQMQDNPIKKEKSKAPLVTRVVKKESHRYKSDELSEDIKGILDKLEITAFVSVDEDDVAEHITENLRRAYLLRHHYFTMMNAVATPDVLLTYSMGHYIDITKISAPLGATNSDYVDDKYQEDIFLSMCEREDDLFGGGEPWRKWLTLPLTESKIL